MTKSNLNWQVGDIVNDGYGRYLILAEVAPRMIAYINQRGIFSFMSAKFIETYSGNTVHITGLDYRYTGREQAERDYSADLFKPFFDAVPAGEMEKRNRSKNEQSKSVRS